MFWCILIPNFVNKQNILVAKRAVCAAHTDYICILEAREREERWPAPVAHEPPSSSCHHRLKLVTEKVKVKPSRVTFYRVILSIITVVTSVKQVVNISRVYR